MGLFSKKESIQIPMDSQPIGLYKKGLAERIVFLETGNEYIRYENKSKNNNVYKPENMGNVTAILMGELKGHSLVCDTRIGVSEIKDIQLDVLDTGSEGEIYLRGFPKHFELNEGMRFSLNIVTNQKKYECWVVDTMTKSDFLNVMNDDNLTEREVLNKIDQLSAMEALKHHIDLMND